MTIATRLRDLNATIEVSEKCRQFVGLARCIAMARGEHQNLQAAVHDNRILLGPVVQRIVDTHHKVYSMPPDVAARQKAQAQPGTTTDTSWALPLAEYNILANAFLESLRNYGCFDKMLPFMRRVPFRTRVGASTIGMTGTTVGQGQVKPISRLTLTTTQIDELKAVCILVLTDELAKFGSTVAGNLFATELSNAVAVETDETFVAVLTSGATSNPSGGATAEHVLHDLRVALAAITTSARSQLFLLTTSAIAKTLSVLHTTTGAPSFAGMRFNGGEIGGITVLISDGVPASTMVLVDATQIAAASETIQLSASNQAIVALNDAPDSPPTASTNLVSLWQNNMVGLKAERYFGVQKLTTTGVAVVTSANFVGDSPG